MKLSPWPRCRAARLLMLVPAIPAVVWALALAIAPTGWARARLIAELEALTGGKVSIDSIHLGPLGNLRVVGIAVAETGTPDDPWVRVAEARLDVHLLQMLAGCCRPGEISLDGLDLRVHRRADGSLEFADLFATRPGPDGTSGSNGSTSRPPALSLDLNNARVRVIDEPTGTRLELSDATGRATYDGRIALIQSLHGKVNGGEVEFAARLDSASTPPAYQAELKARGVSVGLGMRSLGLLVPVVGDAGESLEGRFNLALAVHGPAWDSAGLKGYGSIRLDPIDLGGSKLIEAIEPLRAIPRSARIGSVSSDFGIDAGRVVSDDLTLTVARIPVSLSGWADFSGRIDYRIKSKSVTDRLTSKLPDEVRKTLGDLKRDLGDLTDLRIGGTVTDPVVSAGSIRSGRDLRDEEKVRLKAAARTVLDHYRR